MLPPPRAHGLGDRCLVHEIETLLEPILGVFIYGPLHKLPYQAIQGEVVLGGILASFLNDSLMQGEGGHDAAIDDYRDRPIIRARSG